MRFKTLVEGGRSQGWNRVSHTSWWPARRVSQPVCLDRAESLLAGW